jgi:phenylpropionate dioxygenase-like ring-hydroxylating dioxygenase large terminal subunit
MFKGFAGVWSPLALAREVGRKPRPFKLAGEPVVLFRDRQGRPAALIDRCPHRGVQLSLGRVTGDGCLECPFHGWRFQADGRCAHVPLNHIPEDRLVRHRATALPVREAAGLLWVHTGPDPEDEPLVPDVLTDPRHSIFRLVKTWRAHWTRAMENMLDLPHLPYVHRRTIGFDLRRRLRPDSLMELTTEETPTGMVVRWSLDGQPDPAHLVWMKPNGMQLFVPVPGRQLFIHVWCVPIDQEHTRMVAVTARNFGRYNPLVRLFDQVNRYILHEDQAVVESSQPPIVPPAASEVSVPTDRPTLAFRKYYFNVLTPEERPDAKAQTGRSEPRHPLFQPTGAS